ncbi:NERD domain-containing protein [Bacillus salacetis]|uniref:NERD domain-containing protein n=1 Tax=Bacillus salacetis TaxID=2315464 RepID=A0A3A1QXB5_9BACI|nr:nuclease-related domain-containing protein [Bacillus salacetis]RIW33285.1 NERD domain-containing protein [Bacillus salacetis]
MIIKERDKPIFLTKLEALNRRLSINHEKKGVVSQHLINRSAGYKGEQSLDYFISFLSESEYHILHGLRLFDGKNYCQIDTLLISRKVIIVSEIKRMAGTLSFDPDFNQFKRITEENVVEPYNDPIVQVERQKFQLNKWLRLNTMHANLPIETLVISTSNKAILQTTHGNKTVQEKVIHKEYFPFKISKLEKQYTEKIISTSGLHFLSNLLLQSHTPQIPDILNNYDISPTEILTGVHCPGCDYLPMKRKKGRWVCPKCDSIAKHAHIKALIDYSLLICPKITNAEARRFLRIDSSSTVKRLLGATCTRFQGNNKSRLYLLENLKE